MFVLVFPTNCDVIKIREICFSSINLTISLWKEATLLVTPKGRQVNWWRLPRASKAVYGLSYLMVCASKIYSTEYHIVGDLVNHFTDVRQWKASRSVIGWWPESNLWLPSSCGFHSSLWQFDLAMASGLVLLLCLPQATLSPPCQ